MSRFPLATLAWTLVALVLIDLGFLALREVTPLRRLTPSSLLGYVENGRSVPARLMAEASAGRAIEGRRGWHVAADPARVTTAGRHPPRGGAAPCMTIYGLSFSDHVADVIAEAGAFEVRRVSAPGAPPNWTWAAYLADRAASDCRDVVVWTILTREAGATASATMLVHGFYGTKAYGMPGVTAAEGRLRLRWPEVSEAMVARAARTGDWDAVAAALSGESAFMPAAWRARWADASTLLGFVRRALAVQGLNAQKAATVGSEEALRASGTGEALTLMAAAFAETARRDGSTPVILVIRNRGDGVDLGQALCAADAALPVFSTGVIVDPDVAEHFVADGHYTQGVTDALAAHLAAGIETDTLGCAATLRPAS